MATLYEYLWLFVGNWWAFMTAGPFCLDEALKRVPRAKAWLDNKLPSRRRKRIEVWLMVFGVFLAGFWAWRDEHEARLNADRQVAAYGHVERNPDAFYQLGAIVASVSGAKEDRAHSLIIFDIIRPLPTLNPSQQVQYREFTLSCQNLPPAPDMTGIVAGVIIRPPLINVTCGIIGTWR